MYWVGFVFLVFCVSTFGAAEKGRQVIDLGVLEVQGKLRGPEIQLIESNQMGERALKSASRSELKRLEQKLLEPSQPFEVKPLLIQPIKSGAP
jgi:hypothetical protein